MRKNQLKGVRKVRQDGFPAAGRLDGDDVPG